MSADDNLRDALIEAFITNIREQANRDGDYVRQVDDGLQFDGTMYVAELADVALNVVKDWTVEKAFTVSELSNKLDEMIDGPGTGLRVNGLTEVDASAVRWFIKHLQD